MSQIYKSVASSPSVATLYEGDTGPGAVPVANILNVEGASGISVDATGNKLTITQSASGLTWNDCAISFAAASNNGYFVSATATGTLPAAPAQGDEVEFVATSAFILTVLANAGQSIRIGNDLGTQTVNASIGDSLSLTYRATDLTWYSVTSPQGTWVTT